MVGLSTLAIKHWLFLLVVPSTPAFLLLPPASDTKPTFVPSMSSAKTSVLPAKPKVSLASCRAELEEFETLDPLPASVVARVPQEIHGRYLALRQSFHDIIMTQVVPFLTMPSRADKLAAGLKAACLVLEVRLSCSFTLGILVSNHFIAL